MKKVIRKSLIILLSLLVLSACDTVIDDKGQKDTDVRNYADTLFDVSYVHEIDIKIAEEDWQDLIDNPMDKTKYHADVIIDGETFSDVSFATKGNISLKAVAKDENSQRYSFKINFSKFNKEQDYHGLDKLHLNNSYSDATYMKDVFSYRILREAGVDTPLTSYVWLTVNGEDYGLYVAIEEIGDSFLKRTGLEGGVLFKPESGESDDHRGSSLIYIDENVESYTEIFDNNETKVTEEDLQMVIRSIKALNDETELDAYLDTDAVIRYFVGHNFVCSYDSITGDMLHNYFLYERDGKMTILPWDYNMAFGGFQSDTALMCINKGIDTPLRHTTEEERPVWKWIIDDETYTERYHEIFDEMISSYFESGRYEKEIDEIYGLIKPYVEKDPTAFYKADKFDLAIKTLKNFCLKRYLSIRKQLNGELSTVSELQDEEEMIPADGLHLSFMGRFGFGGFTK